LTGSLALVVAIGPGGIIGRDGGLPWHLSEDLRHFRRVTRGHAIVMGRRTWDSIGRPLPDRHSIVVSRQSNFRAEGATVASTFEAALDLARASDSEPRIIGGAELYGRALPEATHLFITEVGPQAAGDATTVRAGDATFPPFDRQAFDELSRVAGATPGLFFTELLRRQTSALDALEAP